MRTGFRSFGTAWLAAVGTLLLLTATMGARSCVPPEPEPLPCATNADCEQASLSADARQYCAKDGGDCEGEGVCEDRPDACPRLWDPVCGCDGRTSANDCAAAQAGVNVEFRGECPPQRCETNADCEPSPGTDSAGTSSEIAALPRMYCEKRMGDCDGLGVCAERPTACPFLWDPVCGCDGATYPNACSAAAAGVNVEYEGECRPQRCETNRDCEPWIDATSSVSDVAPMPRTWCHKRVGDCEGVGVCEARPTLCPTLWDPVCGCDGETYPNDCVAALAGVNVDYEGECRPAGCETNADCEIEPALDAAGNTSETAPLPGLYCEKRTGDCDGIGHCVERPRACPLVWDPVCGCDGRTYGNACVAAHHGVNVDYQGECEPPFERCRSNADCEPWLDTDASATASPDDIRPVRRRYCAKDPGDCEGVGVCEDRPEACITLYDPVCGCDARTHSNGCFAAMQGVSVDHRGACRSITDIDAAALD